MPTMGVCSVSVLLSGLVSVSVPGAKSVLAERVSVISMPVAVAVPRFSTVKV